jgi:hypothetical protein
MKPNFLILLGAAAAAMILVSGCGKSSSSPNTQPASAEPPSPSPQAAAAPAAQETPAPQAAPATPPAAAETTAAVDTETAKLTTMAKAEKDPVLSSVGTELADKVTALTQAAPANTGLKTQLASSVQSLVAGKDSSALGSFYQAVQSASLTPQQTQLAKEVGNLASAYVVQRNFASLPGAQNDVTTLVSSLRNGELSAAVPPLQKIAGNASLTDQQKQLIGSVADKYAPGLTKAAGTVQQGLNSLRNLGK